MCSPLTHLVPVDTLTTVMSSMASSRVSTTPANTLRRECCAWPVISSVNLASTTLPILSATGWGSENSLTGMRVPEKGSFIRLPLAGVRDV